VIWPPPPLPYFYCQEIFLKAVPGGSKQSTHHFGQSREIEIRGKLRKFAFDRETRIVETYNETD